MRSSPPSPPPGSGPLEHRFESNLSSIRLCRQALAHWLEAQQGVDVDAIDDLLVVCSELVTNAVRHASTDGAASSGATIAARAWTEGDSVVLEVEDDGAGFDWPVARVIGDVLDDDEHGRGLFIVEALTDRLGVLRTADGRSVVRCVKHGVLHHVPTSLQPDLSARFRADERTDDGGVHQH